MSFDEDDQADTPVVHIPRGPQVDRARAAIQGAPADATADHFDQLIRKTALVTTPVRKALVQEEITRRAQWKEDDVQTSLTGQPPAPAYIREELQRRADKVKAGELPFVHVPHNVNFKPQGVEDFTIVKGAGAFSGTYYHAPDFSGADIRIAARDKKNPQGALDAVVSNWKGEEMPVELTSHSRSILRQRVPQLVTVLVIVAGIAAWFYHSHKIDRRISEATEAEAAARESQANSIAARVKNSWNADDTLV